MVIDTGVDAEHVYLNPYISIEDLRQNPIDYKDTNSHGTHVAGSVIKGACKQVKLYSCKYYFDDSEKDRDSENIVHCFQKAKNLQMDYINYSASGKTIIKEEFHLMSELTQSGTVISVAAGNDGVDLNNNKRYPASFDLPNFYVVGNMTNDFKRQPKSNYGLINMVYALGTNVLSLYPGNKVIKKTGTSMSTAVWTNELLKEKCMEENDGYSR